MLARPVGTAAAASVALALGSAGCWPAPGQGPDRDAHNPFEQVITVDSVAGLDQAWAMDTGDAAVGAPIVSGGGVHARAGSVVHTLAPADGAERWTYDGTQPAPTRMSDPIHRDGEVLVGHGFGNVGGNWQARALDARTGEVTRDVGRGLVEGVRGTTMALSSYGHGSGTPVAVNISIVDVEAPGTGWGGLVDLRTNGTGVLLPMTVGTGGAYHAGGGLVTTTPGTAPAIGQGVRRFGTERPETCYTGGTSPYFPCPQWATELDGAATTSPVVGPGEETVYAGTAAGTVYALDAATGDVRWTAAVGARVTAPPALAGGTLFVPTEDGDLVAVAADGCGERTCTPLWTAAAGSEITVQPAVAGGVVFTGSADGTLHAFPAAGCGAPACTDLWSASTGSRITGAPAVSSGRLYAGTGDGRVLAYAPPG